MSTLSFADIGGRPVLTPGRFTPLRSPISFVFCTTQRTPLSVTSFTFIMISPSSSSTVLPGARIEANFS